MKDPLIKAYYNSCQSTGLECAKVFQNDASNLRKYAVIEGPLLSAPWIVLQVRKCLMSRTSLYVHKNLLGGLSN